MPLITNLAERLKRHPKRVVFPEGSDHRILQAARQFASRGLGIPILVGDRATIKETAERLDIRLDGMRIVDPARSDEMPLFLEKFTGLQRFKGLNEKAAQEYLENNAYFATMMLALSQADAIVAGATSSASSALRPFLQILPRQAAVSTISSLNIFDLEDLDTGKDRELFLADCAVVPSPTEEQLCDIAITTASLCYHLTNVRPRVAMLSYSTKSQSSKNDTVKKMKSATALAHQKAHAMGLDIDIDGEMQVDAALDQRTADTKGVGGVVAGKANVLIFPDLHAANIASKLVDVLTRARNYGPILTGFTKPAAEISRGASAHDIFGTSVMVASQAIDHRLLYPVSKEDDLKNPVNPGS